jgi:multidrug efflux pump subunit AcrA (membrane-fusion protein)
MSQLTKNNPEHEPALQLFESSYMPTHIGAPASAPAGPVEEHGPEIEEIISRSMPLLVRWGTLVFAAMMLVLSTVCWFIQYPDIVPASGKLNSVNEPRKVVTKTDGKLVRIAVQEKEVVTAGQVLGYMESTANPTAVDTIDKHVDVISRLIHDGQAEQVLRYFPTLTSPQDGAELGELQPAYQTFAETFMQFKAGLRTGFLQRKSAMLQTDLQTLMRMNAILNQQKALLSQDLALSSQTYEANKVLADNQVIAKLDFRNEQSKLLSKQLTLPQINATIVSNEAMLNQKKEEIAELENQISAQQYTFLQALRTIKFEIQTWQARYILKAPVAGTVAFTGFFQENQEMKSGQSLFYVQPRNSMYFVEVTIPQNNFGKVKLGQQVALKFPAYPYAQYGVVLGQVQYIDANPTNNGYLAKVILIQGLTTNRHQVLRFQQGLVVQAEIVTENMRLLERFYYDLFKQLRR